MYGCLALFEDFPILMILSGMFSQALHISILGTFPSVIVTSVSFVGAVILFFVNHCLAFSFFNSNLYNFSEVSKFKFLHFWVIYN